MKYTYINTKKKMSGISKNDSVAPITIIHNKVNETNEIIENKNDNSPKDNLRLSLNYNKIKLNKNKDRHLSTDDDIDNKEFNNSIHFTLLDYYCLRRLTSKTKEINLFKKGSSLYRKRMDIINVFTLLLLTEKKLLNHEKINKLIKEVEYPAFHK